MCGRQRKAQILLEQTSETFHAHMKHVSSANKSSVRAVRGFTTSRIHQKILSGIEKGVLAGWFLVDTALRILKIPAGDLPPRPPSSSPNQK